MDYNNTWKYLSITELYQEVVKPKAWTALYSFLENDYMSTFYGKWKVRPIGMSLKDDKLWTFLVILAVCQ